MRRTVGEGGAKELPLTLLRIQSKGGSVIFGKAIKTEGFLIPHRIGELGEGATELDLSDWSIVGPPIDQTMRYLVPLAPTLTKLSLKDCNVKGRLPDDDVWNKFEKLAHVDLSGTGFTTRDSPNGAPMCGCVCVVVVTCSVFHMTFFGLRIARSCAQMNPAS